MQLAELDGVPCKIDLSRLKNATSLSPFPFQPIMRSLDVLLVIVALRLQKVSVRVTVIFYSGQNQMLPAVLNTGEGISILFFQGDG